MNHIISNMPFYTIININTLRNFATFQPTRFRIRASIRGLPTWHCVFNDLMWICLYLRFNLWAITTLSVDFGLTISPSVMFSSFLYLSLKFASSDCKSFRASGSEISNDRDSISFKVIRTFRWQSLSDAAGGSYICIPKQNNEIYFVSKSHTILWGISIMVKLSFVTSMSLQISLIAVLLLGNKSVVNGGFCEAVSVDK